MDIILISVFILIGLAFFGLIAGVSNDAVNFLNSSIGSRVAPRYVIMIIASLGILSGVTFSSGMMEVARKGIFHPEFFLIPELITIFLAVMLANVLLLDLFNTFGLPTSTTVSIVFGLLGAAVAISMIKIFNQGDNFTALVNYINTGRALIIIMGILLSVVIAFFFGAITQFITRLIFTFDYKKRLRRYGSIWAGISLSIITYFIIIKGAKGSSFLTPESVLWIETHTITIFLGSFLFFTFVFQLLTIFTKINILKPIVLMGTFALAMAFAANDLVNFIGVPLAGRAAYKVAVKETNPLMTTMEALKQPVHTETFLLLIAGIIMVITLWVSRKARTVTQTELSLGRQDEGYERFGSSALSRIIVRMFLSIHNGFNRFIPRALKRLISNRTESSAYRPTERRDGTFSSFDLIRASVNLIVASAVISFATSLKLPLSTTYVTFMVSMGTSLSDRAWGRESAVYRITGVLTVIGGWFFTAFMAFSSALLFAFLIYYFKIPAIIGLILVAFIIALSSYRIHFQKEKERNMITSFEQTGHFLKNISDTLTNCFEVAFSEDRQQLKDIKSETARIETWANVIVANIFKTLFLLNNEDVENTHTYSHTIRALQDLAESHRDIVLRTSEHFENYHSGFTEPQKEELRKIKTYVTRLLWNTSIMLLQRKKVDYDYIASQSKRLKNMAIEFDKNQINRIQNAESKTRLSILYYSLIEDCIKISNEMGNLLNIFKDSFKMRKKEP